MLGGAEMYIKGEGMENIATSNFPLFTLTTGVTATWGDTLNGKFVR